MNNYFSETDCAEGYIRNDTGECILPSQFCSDPNSIFVINISGCRQPTCANPEKCNCRKKLKPYGCVCKEGYVLKTHASKTCVPKSFCRFYWNFHSLISYKL